MEQQDGCGGGPRARILVVDDDPAVAGVLERYLAACGYEVRCARNGREGLERFQEAAPPVDLVLADLRMPVMDGRALVRALVSREEEVKIVLATGTAIPEDLQPLLDAHGIPTVAKPFELDELGAVVERLLR